MSSPNTVGEPCPSRLQARTRHTRFFFKCVFISFILKVRDLCRSRGCGGQNDPAPVVKKFTFIDKLTCPRMDGCWKAMKTSIRRALYGPQSLPRLLPRHRDQIIMSSLHEWGSWHTNGVRALSKDHNYGSIVTLRNLILPLPLQVLCVSPPTCDGFDQNKRCKWCWQFWGKRACFCCIGYGRLHGQCAMLRYAWKNRKPFDQWSDSEKPFYRMRTEGARYLWDVKFLAGDNFRKHYMLVRVLTGLNDNRYMNGFRARK